MPTGRSDNGFPCDLSGAHEEPRTARTSRHGVDVAPASGGGVGSGTADAVMFTFQHGTGPLVTWSVLAPADATSVRAPSLPDSHAALRPTGDILNASLDAQGSTDIDSYAQLSTDPLAVAGETDHARVVLSF